MAAPSCLASSRRPIPHRRQYIGIWYNITDRTVVWVANREAHHCSTYGYCGHRARPRLPPPHRTCPLRSLRAGRTPSPPPPPVEVGARVSP
ncbi:Os12g0533100 [Oryza sativa Japonica Group]|uniref:Os12g0533100 protein n=1 Tax=Oryza sativa subsp. japonica TaxID=39947 RepID=A0A0P0YAQ7_ORYSJ|nr:Os12g0533100 [Oryza sativa Japonica Group]